MRERWKNCNGLFGHALHQGAENIAHGLIRLAGFADGDFKFAEPHCRRP
jgi:hypothetical protein